MSLRVLSLEQVLQLHVLAIREFGGSEGLRDLSRLESAIASQLQEVFGKELYPTIFDKAAVLVKGIVADHPFVDGNKRTAMLAGLTLLALNDLRFIAQKGELEDFAVRVAVDHLDIPAIAEWMEVHTQKG